MNVLSQLKNLKATATASETTIIDYFLEDYPVNAIKNLQEIAEKTGCSIPTVQRMVVKLGFKGFPDFRKAVLATFSHDGNSSPLSRMLENPQQDKTIVANTYQQTISNIEATFANLPPELLYKAAEILADEKYAVWCLGGRFTGALATLFARHLKTVRQRVREFIPYEGSLADIYADTNQQTLLFVTDIRRYDEPTIKLCQAAKEKGATIILVTDNWLSPAEKSADIVIPVYTNSPCGWDSNACLLVVLEELMNIVTQGLGEDAKNNLRMREDFLGTI
ncbi:MAG: hypothetical protein CR974_01365 [Gammaproteobacteria bacterium]|nr:MAG: hypothetical protein CR974_01365 [Gammaproteobacteria bacterium]